MDPELEQLLSSMSPEELQQLLGMGTLDERQGGLETQAAQAEALMHPTRRASHSSTAAAFNGISDMLGATGGAVAGFMTQKNQNALLGQKDAGRAKYVEALQNALKQATYKKKFEEQSKAQQDALKAAPPLAMGDYALPDEGGSYG